MKYFTPNEVLFSAIFGPAGPEDKADAEARAAAIAAQRRIKDKEEALAIAAKAPESCGHHDCTDAQWLPALVWGNPAAIAIVGDSVYRAHIEMEGYSKLSKLDIENTEVFNVEV